MILIFSSSSLLRIEIGNERENKGLIITLFSLFLLAFETHLLKAGPSVTLIIIKGKKKKKKKKKTQIYNLK